MAHNESKILALFLLWLSINLVSVFLTTYYVYFAWSLLFIALLLIGGVGFYIWLKVLNNKMNVHIENHLLLAMSCHAANFKLKS